MTHFTRFRIPNLSVMQHAWINGGFTSICSSCDPETEGQVLGQTGGTHGVVLLDLKCVFELLLTGTPLRSPPLQGHPGHPRPDQPWRQRQRGQGAHGVKHHLRAEAAAKASSHFGVFHAFLRSSRMRR